MIHPGAPRKRGFSLGGALSALFGRNRMDGDVAGRFEEILLAGDLGPDITEELVERARREGWRGDPEWRERLRSALLGYFPAAVEAERPAEGPRVTLFVGTNGSGKTTTIARMARLLAGRGGMVMLACADTFRAAASEQLSEWGGRLGIRVVTRPPGTDPGSVAYDSIREAAAGGYGEVLIDTAGRLTTRQDLMAELGKVHRVCSRAMPGAPHSTLLVIDASIGQSALPQARQFACSLPLTGLVLTKLDGTARGGAVVAVAAGLGIPVEYAGTGESADDLEAFSPSGFVEALIGGADG